MKLVDVPYPYSDYREPTEIDPMQVITTQAETVDLSFQYTVGGEHRLCMLGLSVSEATDLLSHLSMAIAVQIARREDRGGQ